MFLCFLAKTEVSLTQHLGKQTVGIERQNMQIGKKNTLCMKFQKQYVQSQIHLTQSCYKHKLR